MVITLKAWDKEERKKRKKNILNWFNRPPAWYYMENLEDQF